VCEAIRGHVGRPITLGLRLCLDEMIDGGYGIEECAAFVTAFTQDGTVDYFSFDIGNNWARRATCRSGCIPRRVGRAAARPRRPPTSRPSTPAA